MTFTISKRKLFEAIILMAVLALVSWIAYVQAKRPPNTPAHMLGSVGWTDSRYLDDNGCIDMNAPLSGFPWGHDVRVYECSSGTFVITQYFEPVQHTCRI